MEKSQIKIALLASVISTITAIVYYILQIGFDYSPWILVQVLGISLFVNHFSSILTPYLINPEKKWYFNDALLTLWALILFVLLGLAVSFLQISLNISLLFSVLGYVFLIFTIVKFVPRSKAYHWYFYSFLFVFFAIWVVAEISTKHALKPTFLESYLMGFEEQWGIWYGINTFYHAAIMQSFQTYSMPSTMIHSVPLMYYHYGEHFVFGALSSFTQIHPLILFNVAYPMLIAPLFFRAFLSFIIQLRIYLRFEKDQVENFGYTFWLIFLCMFVQIFKDHYSGGFPGASILMNESTTFSLFLFFSFLSVCIHFWQYRSESDKTQEAIFALVFIPIFFVVICFAKVSTGFVLLAAISYVFLRLQLYRKIVFLGSFFLLILSFIFSYYWVVDTLPLGIRSFGSTGTEFKWFHFFRTVYHNHRFEADKFFIFFYQWLYLFGIFLILKNKYQKNLWGAIRNNFTLPLEILIVIAFAGLLPTVFMVLNPEDHMYFLCVQLFTSMAFLLAYFPDFEQMLFGWIHKIGSVYQWALRIVVSLAIFYGLSQHTIWNLNQMVRRNIQTRALITQNKSESFANNNDRSDEKYLVKNIETLSAQLHKANILQDCLKKNPKYIFIRSLQALYDLPKSEKQKTLLYIDYRTIPFHLSAYCLDVPLLMVATGGLAMYDGMPYNCIPNFDYRFAGLGFPLYKPRDPSTINNKTLTLEELAKGVKSMGYSQVIYYDAVEKIFKKVNW